MNILYGYLLTDEMVYIKSIFRILHFAKLSITFSLKLVM